MTRNSDSLEAWEVFLGELAHYDESKQHSFEEAKKNAKTILELVELHTSTSSSDLHQHVLSSIYLLIISRLKYAKAMGYFEELKPIYEEPLEKLYALLRGK